MTADKPRDPYRGPLGRLVAVWRVLPWGFLLLRALLCLMFTRRQGDARHRQFDCTAFGSSRSPPMVDLSSSALVM